MMVYLINVRFVKKYYLEKYNQRIEYQKIYNKQNQSKINLHRNNRKESDLKFTLACNIRSRTSEAFKDQNIKKTNKTIDLLGCSCEFFKNWILHQLYGKMIEENYSSVWQIDHCLSIASCNLLNENDMKKCFNWVNLRPMYSTENNLKGYKIDHRSDLLSRSRQVIS